MFQVGARGINQFILCVIVIIKYRFYYSFFVLFVFVCNCLFIHSVNGQNSKFAQHILDTGHKYETIEKTMKILHTEKKGQMLDTYERFHIYEISKHNLQLNENFIETPYTTQLYSHIKI
jgi:hypothetical protein